jgi:hypothetical protein
MGPVFAAFGRYLSSRVDLVPEPLGLELAKIADAASPAGAAELREVLTREFGCPPERAFARFDPEPFQSHLLWQTHHARLASADVIVKVIRPDVGPCLADCDLLPLLEQPLTACGFRKLGLKGAFADFHHSLMEEATFGASIEAARLLAQDAQAFDLIGAQRIYTHLSTPHVAVYERWHSLGGASAPELARALCTVWLRQSLQGSAYPVNPTRENTGLASDGRIVFPSGTFATLPDFLRTSLSNYLLAVASEKPEEAVTHLASALGNRLTAPAFDELRRRMHQMVPFRDGFQGERRTDGWPVAEGARFSEDVLIHWRIANENGLMSQDLISFYRGLVTVVRTAQWLSPGCDSLAEAVRDLRLLAAFGQIRDAMQPSQMASLMESYAQSFVGTPERLDRFLTHVANGTLFTGTDRETEAGQGSAENRYVRAICLLVAMAAAALLLHRMTPVVGSGASALTAVLFLGLGLFVLRAGIR